MPDARHRIFSRVIAIAACWASNSWSADGRSSSIAAFMTMRSTSSATSCGPPPRIIRFASTGLSNPTFGARSGSAAARRHGMSASMPTFPSKSNSRHRTMDTSVFRDVPSIVGRSMSKSGKRWRIVDEITGSGVHRLESFLHFHPDLSVHRTLENWVIADEDGIARGRIEANGGKCEVLPSILLSGFRNSAE